jgi:CheY-like chemotaxis protein
MLLNILSVAIRIHPGQQVTLRAETAPGAAAGEASAGAAETGEANLLALAVEGPPQPGLCRPFNEDDMGSLGITARIAALYGGSLAYTPQGQPCQVVLSLPIFHQHQVLIVDDNLDFIQLVTRSLTGTHYLATGERSPRGVLDSVLRLNPDVVLLDVMMPGLDGWEVLGRLRRHPATARIPVIICTVLPQEELALSLGASGFLRKPVTPEQILSALERCSRPPRPPQG